MIIPGASRAAPGVAGLKQQKRKRLTREPQDINKQRANVLYFVGCTAAYDNNHTVKHPQSAKYKLWHLGNKKNAAAVSF